jgi:iron complex outermembrane receptor protein
MKSKMKKILLIAALFISVAAMAQTRGKVIDSKTGEPIKGATVTANDTITTNEKGEFSVQATAQIKITFVGYETAIMSASKPFITVALQQISNQLNEVVVTAYNSKRKLLTVAAPVAVITKADLNRGDNATLIPILNAVPGVKLDYYTYGDYRLNIRGGALAQPSVHSSGYRMYWNDIPITSASGGNPLGGLDPNFISNMEILKGPSSSMYGAGFGGTVLVNTERATKNGTVINTDNMLGEYKTLRSSTGVRSDFNTGNVAFQHTHVESDGYRPMTNTNSNVYNLFGQFYTGKKGTLSYLINYENRKMNIAGDLDSATFRDAPKTVNTQAPTGFGPDKITVGVSYNYRFTDKWSAGIGANYQDNKGEFILSFPFFAIFDKEPAKGLNTRATITHKTNFGKTAFRFNAGVEVGTAKNKGISYNGDFTTDTAIVTNINEAKTNQFLGFAQAEFIFPQEIYITAGFSYNNYNYDVKSGTNTAAPVVFKTNAAKLVPRISVLKKFGTIAAYVAAGQGFSPPAAGIFNDFLNFDGSVNNNLKSASGWNFEIGSRGNTKNGIFFYDITYYNLSVNDAIISRLFEISPGVNAERKTNAGEVKQQGIEALAGVNFAKEETNFWKGSQCRVGYTFNDYTYKDYRTFKTDFDPITFNPIYTPVDYKGKDIPGTIRNAWVGMLDLQTKPGVYFNYTISTYSDTYLTNENTAKLDAYNVMNVRLGYKKSLAKDKFILHPYVGINNLGNTLYSSLTAYNSTFGGFFNPGYRRQFFGGLQMSLRL